MHRSEFFHTRPVYVFVTYRSLTCLSGSLSPIFPILPYPYPIMINNDDDIFLCPPSEREKQKKESAQGKTLPFLWWFSPSVESSAATASALALHWSTSKMSICQIFCRSILAVNRVCDAEKLGLTLNLLFCCPSALCYDEQSGERWEAVQQAQEKVFYKAAQRGTHMH